MPKRSLKLPTLIFGVFDFCEAIWVRNVCQRVAMKDQLVGKLDQYAIAQQQGDDFLRANLVYRQ